MTLDETLQWIANIFEEPVENIKPDIPRDEIEAWDSLGILTLMAGLDEEFDITMKDTEIQDMQSVQDIVDVFRKEMGNLMDNYFYRITGGTLEIYSC